MSRIKLYQGDCLEVMRSLPDDSIDSVITDPPYGTTSCKWDIVIPLEEMWTELKEYLNHIVLYYYLGKNL